MKRLLSLTVAVSAICAFEAQAATPIVVYALRAPLEINQVASSVTVVTAEEIARENKRTVPEVLRTVPGLNVTNNGGVGQTTRVFMRGTNSNHVLVIMDGVIINDPSDPGTAFDFSNLTTDNIERIEVLRGPQSTLYGSQAIGGVINIITKKGRGEASVNGYAEYGRYTTARLGGGVSGTHKDISYSFQLARSHTDGISSYNKTRGGVEKDGSDTYTLSANLSHRVTNHFTAKLTTRYNRSDTEFDSIGSFVRPVDDADPVNDSRQLNVRGAGELSLLDGRWMQEFGISRLYVNRAQITEYYDTLFNTYFGRQQYKGWRDTVDWVHRISVLPEYLAVVGAEASSQHFKSYSNPGGTPEVNVDNQALFLENQLSLTPELYVNASGRVDRHQTFGKHYTWKIAPGYNIDATGTRLKASYGTGFKAPSLFDLYDTTFGNAALTPETSRGYDVGFEQSFLGKEITFGATWFHNRIDDLISVQLVNPGPPAVYQSVNIGEARTQGVESALSWRPCEEWTFNATHTFVQADNVQADTRLLRRPKHMANVSAVYTYAPRADIGVNVRYVGLSKDIDINFPYGPVENKAFTTLDIVTNYPLNDTTTLYGRIENLFDKRYEEIYGYGAPGMGLYVGAKASF